LKNYKNKFKNLKKNAVTTNVYFFDFLDNIQVYFYLQYYLFLIFIVCIKIDGLISIFIDFRYLI